MYTHGYPEAVNCGEETCRRAGLLVPYGQYARYEPNYFFRNFSQESFTWGQAGLVVFSFLSVSKEEDRSIHLPFCIYCKESNRHIIIHD